LALIEWEPARRFSVIVAMKLPRICILFIVPLSVGLTTTISDAAERLDLVGWDRYLGIAGQPEWTEFAGRTPDGARLDLFFDAPVEPEGERCLLIRHRGVKLRWQIKLNDRAIGSLPTLEQEQITAFSVPAGAIQAQGNRLTLVGPDVPDDIEIGEVTLIGEPVAKVLGEASIEVRVTDEVNRKPIPCRITVTTPDGALVPLRAESPGRLAVREGVIYTGDGAARFTLAAGSYVIWASRGFEWSAASLAVTAAAGQPATAELSLQHEVPVPGWISVDSHIHTLTDSGHGDSTIDERMLTIAGEGIELAVATDHNHHADYTPAAARMGVTGLFQSVTGNEVTTKLGHFNAFPILPGSAVVDHSVDDWEALVSAMRATPEVRVVILNHPRNLHSGFIPMGPTQFDTVTGKHRRAEAFRGIDGFEVVTSAAMQSDIHLLFRDWFALLNRGHRISGVGSSDTHDVNRFLLGQARTYVAADDSGGRFDLNEVWKSYEEGRLLISMGLLTDIRIDGEHRTGDLAKPASDKMEVAVTVTGPSWTRADRVELYANGHLIREAAIQHADGAIDKARQVWQIPTPAHDTHLVAIATGPGVTAPFSETARPYQPSSRDFNPRVIGATNPVWIDGDGDGGFSAPLQTARKLMEAHGGDARKLIPALARYDEAVAVQVASLLADAGATGDLALDGAADFVRRGFEAVLKR
jgi:hypothetical protein